MKILVTETFLNRIPGGRETFVLDKMSQFVNDYIESKFNMSAMRAGISVREIKNNRHGLRIFKLRINKGDRILFTFDTFRVRPEFRKSILFLDYCHHDDQGFRGRMIGVDAQKVEQIKQDEEAFEEWVDKRFEAFEYDPNEVITRVVDVSTMNQMFDDQDERAVYYLNDEQFACLQIQDSPAFIFGSAGSGKTTINIYKAFLLALQPKRIGYFTYSSFLVEDAKKLFRKVAQESPEHRVDDLSQRVQFHHFYEYISTEINQFQTVHYAEFHKWVVEHHPILLRQIGIEVYDVWREIRGIIKGMIPKEWMPYDTPASEVAPDLLEQILRRNLGHISGSQLILHAQQLYELKKSYLDPYALRAVLLMHHYLDKYLVENSLIGRETYLQLDEQYCVYTSDQRQGLYEVALSYEAYLKRYGKLDENDMARLFLNKLNEEKVNLFDFVIADEIQDLTELQIYCLIRLTRNRNQLLFSGDINQTIRPTYFHTGRIESLMKTSNVHSNFKKVCLVKNYRSPKEVVDLANDVIDLRVRTLGIQKKDDYKEVAIRPRRSDVFLCRFQNLQDLVNLMEAGLQRHYVAIVVADEAQKSSLNRLTSLKGAVFTVEEIKGIEKDYIICYNVMSYWEATRYHFNLLYVALTRARQQLCFVEDQIPKRLSEELDAHFFVMDHYDEGTFGLTQQSTDNEFYKSAQLYERRELYEQAIAEYGLSRLPEAKRDMARCDALMLAKAGHHEEAGHALMKLKEYERAALCYRQGRLVLLFLKALVYQGLPFEQVEAAFFASGFAEAEEGLLTFVYTQPENPGWLRRLNKLYAHHLNRRLKVIDHLEESINQFQSN